MSDKRGLLTKAFETASNLHKMLTDKHPRNSGYLTQLIDSETDLVKAQRFTKLRDYLFEYGVNEDTNKNSWLNQKNILKRKARDFVNEFQTYPKSVPQFLEYVIDHIDDDKRIIFNTHSNDELRYNDIFERVTKRQLQKPLPVPDHIKQRHAFNYNDLKELEFWLKTPESIPSTTAFQDRFLQYVEHQHIFALMRMVQKIKQADLLPPSFINTLYQEAVKTRRKFDNRHSETSSYIPLEFKAYMKRREIENSTHMTQMSKDLDISILKIVGISEALSDDRIYNKINFSTFDKIRHFFAHEFENFIVLNKASLMMSLIFPDYKDFTDYATKKAKYNEAKETIKLEQLIDVASLGKKDLLRDLTVWADALRTNGPVINYYIKNSFLIDDISINEKGALRISDIDTQLYRKITELVSATSKADIKKYHGLKIVRDIQEIKEFQKRCLDETRNKELSSRTLNVPQIDIDGARFGRPDLHFGFLDYDDPYYPIIGRFTDSCERAGGDYEDTLLKAYINRKTGVWCIFDKDEQPIAHTLIERRYDGQLLIKGFEGQSIVNRDLLKQVVNVIREDYPEEDLIVGTSSLRIGYEEVRTVKREELLPGHKVKVDVKEIFDEERFIEDLPRAPAIYEFKPPKNG